MTEHTPTAPDPDPEMVESMFRDMKNARANIANNTCESCAAFVPKKGFVWHPVVVMGICCLRSREEFPRRRHSDWCLEHAPLKEANANE